MVAETSNRLAYQRALRVIGAWLDRQPPMRFRLIEEPLGYSVVLESGSAEPTLQLAHFTSETLETQAEQLRRGKRVFGRGNTEPWSLATTTREDVLRALGYELDEARAREISVDELGDALLVTYSYVEPSQGFNWRKRWATLHAPEISELLRVAQSRRSRRGLLGMVRR